MVWSQIQSCVLSLGPWRPVKATSWSQDFLPMCHKELEELHWTLMNWNSMHNFRDFPWSQDGPKQLRGGQLVSIPHSAAQHGLPSDACYNPLAGSSYLLTQKIFIAGGWLLVYKSIRLKFPIFLSTAIMRCFCYIGQNVVGGVAPPHLFQLYNQCPHYAFAPSRIITEASWHADQAGTPSFQHATDCGRAAQV